MGLAALERIVRACRCFATCDLFVHTWSTLNAATAVWHHDHAGSASASASCVAALREHPVLRPVAIEVSDQPPAGCAVHGEVLREA